MDGVKSCFPPVVDPHVRLLVLGSLPGEQSLALAQYYGNPRNHFWRLMSAVIGRDLVALGYEDRLEALLAAGVGLWDSVGSASRRGSLDAAIKGAVTNDLAALAETLPELEAVAFNGGKSAALGQRQLARREDLALVPLPSSSPAFTMAYEEKLRRWMRLKEYLKG